MGASENLRFEMTMEQFRCALDGRPYDPRREPPKRWRRMEMLLDDWEFERLMDWADRRGIAARWMPSGEEVA